MQLNRCTTAMYHVVNEMLLSVSFSLLLFCVSCAWIYQSARGISAVWRPFFCKSAFTSSCKPSKNVAK